MYRRARTGQGGADQAFLTANGDELHPSEAAMAINAPTANNGHAVPYAPFVNDVQTPFEVEQEKLNEQLAPLITMTRMGTL